MRVGFTGTSETITVLQKTRLKSLLEELNPEEFHHGDCVGADAEAHMIALDLSVVVVHPPTDSSKRAFCTGGHIRRPKPYLDRNQDIVDETDVLIALPSRSEYLRSGTWSTVRRARKAEKPIWIVMPNGYIAKENMSAN